MRRAILTACCLALGACGFGPAPAMVVGERCALGDMTVELEVGYPSTTCAFQLQLLAGLRAEYEAQFGHQDLTGRPVRLRVLTDLRDDGVRSDWPVSGHTYDDAIDLAVGGDIGLPHELNHVRKGGGHGGWCVDFEPWSEAVLGVNQRAYLGCQ